jgi:hypothetical protein
VVAALAQLHDDVEEAGAVRAAVQRVQVLLDDGLIVLGLLYIERGTYGQEGRKCKG